MSLNIKTSTYNNWSKTLMNQDWNCVNQTALYQNTQIGWWLCQSKYKDWTKSSSAFRKTVNRQSPGFSNIHPMNNKWKDKCKKIEESFPTMKIRLLCSDRRYKDWTIIWRKKFASWIMSRLNLIAHNTNWIKPATGFKWLRVTKVTNNRDQNVHNNKFKDWQQLFVHMNLKLHKLQQQFKSITKNLLFYHNKINV